MTRLRHWLGTQRAKLGEPTLVRRGVLTVSLFFILIWAVLLGYQYWQMRWSPAAGRGMQYYGQAMLSAVDRFEQADAAGGFLAATEQWLNIRRREIGLLPDKLKYELRDSQGRLVYWSRGLDKIELNTATGRETEQRIQGRNHRLYQAESAKWRLTVLEPWRTDLEFLQFNGKALLPFLLLAFPFVLAPLWLSVRLGLNPLQVLANLLAKRKEGDLSPLGFKAQHAELKPLEKSIDGLLQQLRQKLARERAFVQDAAHEIRTPLAVISAQAHVMAGARSAKERLHAQAQLEHAIARASHLSSQLLALAALDDAQGPQSSQCSRVDIAQHLRQTMAGATVLAMARQIDLSLDAPDSLTRLMDLSAFQSIAQNLLDNALRYVQVGGSVVVSLSEDHDRLCLAVQDNGPGIAAADLPNVFDRFYRGDTADTEGSGLGLAIVRQASLRLGGSVTTGPGLDGMGIGFFVRVA